MATVVIVDLDNTLVAYGDDDETVTETVRRFVEAVPDAAPQVERIVVLSNGRRVIEVPSTSVYRHRARKPFTPGMADLGRSVAVVGDQPLTDGLLAWRLGAPFLHLVRSGQEPWWPRLMRRLGTVVVDVLFLPAAPPADGDAP